VKKLLIVCGAMMSLTACGGGDTASSEQNPTGTINIGLTDASVDDVSEVWVEFTGVMIKPQSGDEMEFAFDSPKSINLLEFQNGETAELLPDTQVPVGPYNWIRLGVSAEFDNVLDSYALRVDGTQVELRIPSGSQNGLKLVSGFTITQDQSTNIVLDWDLRKALSDPPGQPGMHLRPALRVTNMAAFGTLRGTVDFALVDDDSCSNNLTDDTGNAVYIYQGEVADPVDIRGADTDPLVTSTVSIGTDDVYRYEVSYLSVGEYSAAFTCQASDDEPEAENDIAFPVVATGVMIVNGETTMLDFSASE